MTRQRRAESKRERKRWRNARNDMRQKRGKADAVRHLQAQREFSRRLQAGGMTITEAACYMSELAATAPRRAA